MEILNRGWQRTDVLVMVGAGASMPAGIPPYREWISHLDPARFPLLEDVWVRGYSDYELEDMVDAVSLGVEIGSLPRVNKRPDPTGPAQQLLPADLTFMHRFDEEQFLNQVRFFIASMIAPHERPHYYDELAKQLMELAARKECDQRVTVVSSNWDTFLEDALVEHGGYVDMGTGRYRGSLLRDHHHIQVCKAHGSLGVSVANGEPLRFMSARDWLGVDPNQLRKPLVGIPGVGKRAKLAATAPDYMRETWRAVGDAWDAAGCVVSLGYGWHETDRDLHLLARRYPGRSGTVKLYNNGDPEAAKRAASILRRTDPSAILASGGVKEAIAERIDRLAVTALVGSHHGTAISPPTKAWIKRTLPALRDHWRLRDDDS